MTRRVGGGELSGIPPKEAPPPNLVILRTFEEAEPLTPLGFDLGHTVVDDGKGTVTYLPNRPQLKAGYSFKALMNALFPERGLRGLDLRAGNGWFIDDVHGLLGADHIMMGGTEIEGSPWLMNAKRRGAIEAPDFQREGRPLTDSEALAKYGEKSMDFVSANAPYGGDDYSVIGYADKLVKDDGVIYFSSGKIYNLRVSARLLGKGYYVMLVPFTELTERPRQSGDDSCDTAVMASRTPKRGFAYMAETSLHHVGDQALRRRLLETWR